VSVTASIASAPSAPLDRTSNRPSGDIPARVAGIGALVFVGSVIAQNVLRGSSAPGNGADAQEVLTHYADHRATTFVLVALFVAGAAGLTTFLGGAVRRMVAGPRSAWAYAGLVGAVGILALFGMLVASEQAVTVVAHGATPDTGAIAALWALHNSVFAVLLLMIGVALLGLSRAGVAAGITPPVFDRIGPIGSALLAVGALAGPAIAGGDAMALFGVSVIGFVLWLAFLVTTGLRLVRSDRQVAA
jgi:hypothetical protein